MFRLIQFRVLLLLWSCGAGGQDLYAQQNDVPLNRDIYYDLDRNHACLTDDTHTGLRPYIQSRANTEGVLGFRPDSGRYYYQITELLFKRHLFEIKQGDFRATIDPVFQFDVGFDFSALYTDSTYGRAYHNGRGIRIAADFGPKVSVQTTFYENQADLPVYLYLYANQQGAVPGQGRVKTLDRQKMDFAWAMGNVSYTPWRWLNLQFGNDRMFVGDGYRSLLLSDNTSPYPYFKASVLSHDKRWQYSTINTKMEVFTRLPTGGSAESLFYWKRASFHHLSFNAGPLQLGLFESTMWRTIDSSGVLPMDGWQLNPVIGLNTLFGADPKQDGMLVGMHAKIKLTDKMFAYGQLALDGAEASRNGWQAGLQWFDLFRKDIHVLVEYNAVTPFLYSNADANMNYAHAGQPLAHPMGAALNEMVLIMDLRIKKKLWAQCKINQAMRRTDRTDADAFGGDIFKPGIEQAISEGPIDRRTTYLDLSFSRLMNQMTNMRVTAGWQYRDVTPGPVTENASYFYVGFRTGLFNRYYDL